MSAPPAYILDGTAANFGDAVIRNSHKGPVVVNFWSPGAGPCLRLWPVLEELARAYQGRFLLVNVNVDREQRVARDVGVGSVPTVKIYHRGEVVETVHGFDHAKAFRRLIDRYVPRDSDQLLVEALKLYQAGDSAAAFDLMDRAAAADPDNPRIPLTHAKLRIREGQYAEAEARLNALPRTAWGGEASQLLAHLGFLLAAQDAPPLETLLAQVAAEPENCEHRYRLAAVSLAADDYDAAVDQLLEILRRDRTYRDGAAVRGLSAIFRLLGNDDPRVKAWRGRMLDGLE